MKPIYILPVLFLSACGSATNQSLSLIPSSQLPVKVISAIPTATPTVTPSPSPTVSATPSPSPSVSPSGSTSLSCYLNGVTTAYCSGANVGATPIQLDLVSMFTGGNPQVQITQVTIENAVIATHFAVCAQPNGAGCFQESSCVTVQMFVAAVHQSYVGTFCGNAVNIASSSLEDL